MQGGQSFGRGPTVFSLFVVGSLLTVFDGCLLTIFDGCFLTDIVGCLLGSLCFVGRLLSASVGPLLTVLICHLSRCFCRSSR